MKKIFSIIIVVTFMSCSNKSADGGNVGSTLKESQSKKEVIVAADSLNSDFNKSLKDSNQIKTVQQEQRMDMVLNTFKDLPKEIDGCGCYFYLSKNDEKEAKYIFVNDFADAAFVSINKKLEKFKLKEHKDDSNTYFYFNADYDLIIEITKRYNGGDETSLVEGVIILTKGKNSIKNNFIGSCGC
mgnify:CR=1 FL=1